MFELVTGLKGVPQDRQQRLAVMALGEERMTGRVRHTVHIPTDVMLSDALTKPRSQIRKASRGLASAGSLRWMRSRSENWCCQIAQRFLHDELDIDFTAMYT
eukprot:8371310-Pyramimonas_sp.AAC.1